MVSDPEIKHYTNYLNYLIESFNITYYCLCNFSNELIKIKKINLEEDSKIMRISSNEYLRS